MQVHNFAAGQTLFAINHWVLVEVRILESAMVRKTQGLDVFW